jgi:hypothetical protein
LEEPADAGPVIAGNWVAGYSFGSNPVAGYGVADVPVPGDMLPATGSSFTVEILINTSMCYMFSQINGHVLYILVKDPGFYGTFSSLVGTKVMTIYLMDYVLF